MAKLTNNHLFYIRDFGIDQESIIVFLESDTDVLINRSEFEKFLTRHDKVNTTSESYWNEQLEDQFQDLYEFLVLGKFTISQVCREITQSVYSILNPAIAV